MSNVTVPLNKARSNKRALALSSLLIAGLAVASTNSAASAGATSRTAVVASPIESRDPRGTDQIIVRMRDGSTPDIAALAREAGESVSLNRKMRDGGWVSKLSGRRSPAALAAIAGRIAALPNVAYAEPDLKMFAAVTPNDPLFPVQWELFAPSAGLSGINTPAAWDITHGTSDVVVAVIDTGITAHADLAGQTVPGYDFITNTSIANDGGGRDADPSDPGDWVTTAENALGTFAGCGASNSSWHGTHVSGTIGAKTDNAIGVAGIASGAKILPVRVLGKCGGSTSDIADAIRWAAGLAVTGVPTNPNPAAVLSISLGGLGACPATYQNAINDAIAVGASVVVAAGNSTADASTFAPANCAGVITVAATGATGNRSFYSNFGTSVEIAAPGGDSRVASNGTVAAAGDSTGEIASTLNSGLTTPSTDIYAYYQGTSMATPHVSGVAALVKSVQPSITPAALTALLRSTSTPFVAGSTCTTALCGTGILDAANAVTAAAAVGPRTLGAFSKTSPAAGTTGAALAPTLTWAPSTGASSYEYCVVAGVATPCTTWISTGAATSVALSGLGSNTLYSWQVRATDAAGTATAEANVSLRYTFTTGAAAGAFAKTAPANAATGIATTRSLTWGASTGATSYEYCIDLVVNNACDATWVSTGVTRSATVGPLLGSTRYEWQVRARNTIGVVTANANVAWTFTTLAPPLPGAFAKTSPTRNQTGRPLALTLSWGASTSTTSYQYCVDTVNNNLCDTAWVSTGTTRTAAITGLAARTPYYWQVRAIGAGGTTLANAGTWWLFTTA